jgi:DNA (cytosine-5)-methyltransferase 1
LPLSENDAPLRVIELFAGVGGFRLGLEGLGTHEHPSNGSYKTVWSNQWEPSTKRQHASDVYVSRWGAEGHCNADIFSVLADPNQFKAISNARPDVLVGGFPCQDYSVAKPADKAAGLEGKKGVLWWAIHGILAKQASIGQPVKYLLLENVDRLLKSPTACRGRDFAIILSSLAALGYAAEWRVVNAADYGFPQKRRRTFIVAYHRSTRLFDQAASTMESAPERWLAVDGVLPSGLPANPVDREAISAFRIGSSPLDTQAAYLAAPDGSSRFRSGGAMVEGSVWTAAVDANDLLDFDHFVGQDRPLTLGDVVGSTGPVSTDYLIDDSALPRWRFLKGAKSQQREAKNGHKYEYSEGAMSFPDPLSRPARTIITAEGGSAASRTKHAVLDPYGALRRLTVEELEELNWFPRGFTQDEGVSDTKRAFMMGNALVVGLVSHIGDSLAHAVLKGVTPG